MQDSYRIGLHNTVKYYQNIDIEDLNRQYNTVEEVMHIEPPSFDMDSTIQNTSTITMSNDLETMDQTWWSVPGVYVLPTKYLLGDQNRYAALPLINLVPAGGSVAKTFAIEFMWNRQLHPTGSLIAFGRDSDVNNPTVQIDDNGTIALYAASGSGKSWTNALVNAGINVDSDVKIRVQVRGSTLGGWTARCYINDLVEGLGHGWGFGTVSVRSMFGADIQDTNNMAANSTMWNVVIYHEYTGDRWEWPMNEGSGTTLFCYDSVGDPIPSLNALITPDAEWGSLT